MSLLILMIFHFCENFDFTNISSIFHYYLETNMSHNMIHGPYRPQGPKLGGGKEGHEPLKFSFFILVSQLPRERRVSLE